MKSIPWRLMVISKILSNIIWIVAAGIGIVYGIRGYELIDQASVKSSIIVDENINTILKILKDSVGVIEIVDQSLSTMERSSIDAGLSLIESQPLVRKTSQVLTQDLPIALEEMQNSMPSVIGAAAAIDQTLYILSRFTLAIPNIFGSDLEVGLGINYDPEISLEGAISQLSGNLEDIPVQMRSLEKDLDNTNSNIGTMSENLISVASDLDKIREQLSEIITEFELIITNLENLRNTLNNTYERSQTILVTTRNIFVGLMMLIIFAQIPSLYFGFLMVKGGLIMTDQLQGENND
jgi:hypothetical protein